MIYLNYLYFLILTYFELKYLKSKGREFQSPLDNDQRLWFSGPEVFWVILFSTGVIALSGPGIVDLMALRLLFLEILCLVAIMQPGEKVYFSAPIGLYAIYLIWILIGCLYSPSPGYGFRVFLKYSYPLLIALTASAIVRNIEVMLVAGIWARRISLLSILFMFVPYINRAVPGFFWYGTALAVNYISMVIFSVTLFFFTNEKRKNFIYAIIFMIPCFIWVFRTSIMGTGVALMALSIFRYKIRSLPIIIGIFVVGIIAVFTIPSLRSKMFNESDNVSIEQFQQGKISQDNINSNARYAMWEKLEERFYKGNELTGSGTGAIQNYMYNNFVFGGLRVPHSDYVQLCCDNGEIGFWLYICALLGVVVHCFIIYWNNQNSNVRLAAMVAGSSLVGVMATLYSDNVVNYSMATLSMPFGFYGMMLGMLRKQKEQL